MSPRKEQRRGMRGRSRRSRALGAADPRSHRDPQATYQGSDYREPLYVDEDGQLALRVDDSTSPAIEVGPDGLRFQESTGYVQPEPLEAATISATSSLQRKGVEVGHLTVPLYQQADSGSRPPWNTLAGEFPNGTSNFRVKVDLQRYDEFRFRFICRTAANPTTADLQIGYSLTQTTALTSLGAAALSVITGGNAVLDTGWTDLPGAAQIEDCYIGITAAKTGGGTSAGILDRITVEFRAKTA